MPRIYALQYEIIWEDKAANHAQVEKLLDAARPEPGSLVVLPEMFDTGFSLTTQKTAEEYTDDASETWCARIARKHEIYLQGASVHQPSRSEKATNNAVVFDPSGLLLARYEKIQPFSHGRESEVFRGGSALTTFTWHGFIVCPLICYDLRFPELFRIATIDAGVHLFTLGASWPAPRQHHWLTLLKARAIENQAYVVGLNRCGNDPHLPYVGGSRIFDPHGHELAQADNTPATLSADLDVDTVNIWRTEFNVLADVNRENLGAITINSK